MENDRIKSHMQCLQVGENKFSKNGEPTQTDPQIFQQSTSCWNRTRNTETILKNEAKLEFSCIIEISGFCK